MNIVFYTSGINGIGRLVFGLSIYNALLRCGFSCRYTILSSASTLQARVLDKMGVSHREIPPEREKMLLSDRYKESLLYKILEELKPDILIVDRMWFTLAGFIEKLFCKKIFITSQVSDNFYHISHARVAYGQRRRSGHIRRCG